jgi:hypothetical protein
MEWHGWTRTFNSPIIALLAAVSALVTTADVAAQDNSTAVSGQLGVWEGQWSYNETDYETPYSHAHKNSGTGTCNWAPNRGFIVCDYLNASPGNGVPTNDLGVFTYNPVTKTYARLGVFQDATTFAEAMTVEGNTWTTSAEIPYHGKTLVSRTVYVFSSDDTRTDVTSQISADKGRTWTTQSQFTAEKVATAAAPETSLTSAPTGQLEIWDGRWSYDERDFETPYSHANTNSGNADCDWAPNHAFIICDNLNGSPANGVPLNDLVVVTYDPTARAYGHLAIFKNGTADAEKMTMDANTWTTSAEIPYHGKTVIYRTVYVFAPDDKGRTTTSSISADKGATWTTITQFTTVKVGT